MKSLFLRLVIGLLTFLFGFSAATLFNFTPRSKSAETVIKQNYQPSSTQYRGCRMSRN